MDRTSHDWAAPSATESPKYGVPERLGISLPIQQRRRLVGIWLRARLIISVVATAITLFFWLLWGLGPTLGAAALVGTIALDSYVRTRFLEDRNAAMPVLIDVATIFALLAAVGVGRGALGLPFAYFLISSLLLLDARWAVTAVALAGSAFALVGSGLLELDPEIEGTRVLIVGVVVSVVFVTATVGLLRVMMRIMNRANVRRADQARLQESLAKASNALLASTDPVPLQRSVELLLAGTDAATVWITKNVTDEVLGPSSVRITGASRSGLVDLAGESPGMRPLRRMPGRSELEAGRRWYRDLDEDPDGSVDLLSTGADARSTLSIPILIKGEWWGTLHFTDIYQVKPWLRRHEELLATAAEMVGAYVERTQSRHELDRTITDLDAQARYQQALAACASALQTSDDDDAVDLALRALLEASNADYAYIDENYADPVRGPSARIIADAESVGAPRTHGTEEWWGGPHAELPTSYAALRSGQPIQIITTELEGRERQIYEADGLRSELCVPINVGEEWRGSMAFADYRHERRWTATEISVFRTGARMIGAFWERRDARRSLETVLSEQNRRLELERTVAKVAQSLLAATGPAGIDQGLQYALDATDAHAVFVERNTTDPRDGLVAEIRHEAFRLGFEHLVHGEIWTEPMTGEVHRRGTSYRRLPTIRNALERGRPIAVVADELPESERRIHAATGYRTELFVPIEVGGHWVGSIRVADQTEHRAWAPDEVELATTVAGMIGLVWSRAEPGTGPYPLAPSA